MSPLGPAARLLAVVTLAAALGCPGSSDFGPLVDAGEEPDAEEERDARSEPRPDRPPATCTLEDGQSCEGGQICPGELNQVREDDGKCRCRLSCDPDDVDRCGGTICDRICVPMTDSTGQPIPGLNICMPNKGAGEGESCAPAACKIGLHCVGELATKSFCRRECNRPEDCKGYKMVCGSLEDRPEHVCVPGETPGGITEGEDCTGNEIYCRPDLLCDPETKRCLPACNTDHDTDPCAPGECSEIADHSTGVVLGWACR